MFARIRRRLGLSPLMFGVLIALSLAGTAGAAARLITGKQVKDNSLTGKDVKDGSLQGKDFAKGQLPAGAPGAQGPAGPAGAKGDPTYTSTFVVNPDGTPAEAGARLKSTVAKAAASGTRALVWLEPGVYEVSGTLNLGALVSLAGSGRTSTRLHVEAATGCGIEAPTLTGAIRDLEIETAAPCGIGLAAPSQSLELVDISLSNVDLDDRADAIRLRGAAQTLQIDRSTLRQGYSQFGSTVISSTSAGSHVTVTNSTASMVGLGANSIVFAISGSSASGELIASEIGTDGTGVSVSGAASLAVRDSVIRASGAATLAARDTSRAELIGSYLKGALPSASVGAAVVCIDVVDLVARAQVSTNCI